jgi:hypothetical protein
MIYISGCFSPLVSMMQPADARQFDYLAFADRPVLYWPAIGCIFSKAQMRSVVMIIFDIRRQNANDIISPIKSGTSYKDATSASSSQNSNRIEIVGLSGFLKRKSVLDYIATSNHTHIIVEDDGKRDIIPSAIGLISGKTAKEYNQRKKRRGTF